MAKSDSMPLTSAVEQPRNRTGLPIKRIGGLLILSAVLLGTAFNPDWPQQVRLPTSISHCFHSQNIEDRVTRILSNTPLIGKFSRLYRLDIKSDSPRRPQ